MGFLEKIYNGSPIFFQNLMVTVAGYQKNKQRYGKIYWEQRAFLSEFDTWTFEEQQAYQNKELTKFIRYAAKNSSFYKQLYADVDLDQIQSVQDLKLLPIVDKEMLRSNMKEIVTVPEKGAIIEKTGGTTGTSLVIFRTVEDQQKRMAMLDHFKSRVGFENRKMKRAIFSAKPIVPPKQKQKIFWRYNAAGKQMIYTPFRLSEENIKYYVNSLNRFKPHAMEGYFSSMCDIAQYIERHQLSLAFTPIAIFPTSETLTKSGRELLERVFRCKVYDQYASSEGAPFVTECSCQTLHMEMASGVFEPFEEDSNEVLVTSFTSHGTPLIRYQIGDAMIFSEESTENCHCGLDAPIIREIQGRTLDFLYTADGVKMNAANVTNLFKVVENAIVRTQIIQNQKDEIIILLEVDKQRYEPKHEVLLTEEFQRRFGINTSVTIQYTDQIPKEKSGKFRMIKNNVDIQN